MAQNARQAALAVLTEVGEGGYLNIVMKNRLNGLAEQDKRFAAALCFAALENQLRIDYVIDHFTAGKRVHRLVREVLRLGTAQLLFMDGVPESAAVNESVKIIAGSPKRQLKGFVNAVLRAIARDAESIEYPDKEADPAGYISLTYSYPRWIAEKYIADYGVEFACGLLACRKAGARTCIRPNRIRLSAEALAARLDEENVEYTRGRYQSDAFYIKNISTIEEWDLFKNGDIAVQGEASMLAVDAAGIRAGDAMIDVCAAPGGKSAYAAQSLPASITAMDIHAHRVALMRANFARLGVTAETAVGDASVPRAEFYGGFDVVLIDAPCSALGLLYRKPDIKNLKKSEDLPALASAQREILETCSRYVKKGGRLIYSTCTIDKLENDDIIDDFLARHSDFYEGDLAERLPNVPSGRICGGRMQLFPHIDGIDGFFIAALERRAKA